MFDFKIKLFFIYDSTSNPVNADFYGINSSLYYHYIAYRPEITSIRMYYGDSTSNWDYCNFIFNNNTIKYYSSTRDGTASDAQKQHNKNGTQYYYLAFGF